MPRYVKPVLNLTADDVWSAACAAQRINGAYLKFGNPENKTANRDLITAMLGNTDSSIQITDADREQGEVVRTYYKGLTFKILCGTKLSDFDNTAMVLANRDVITSTFDLAVIASLPSCFIRASARDSATRRINFAEGGFIGSVGDKVNVSVEVVKVIYSQQWNTYYISGITDTDQAVFFAYKTSIDLGAKINIAGTVKAHKDNSTQLNRVKVL